MAWVAPAIGAAGSILGGMMNKKAEDKAAEQSLEIAKYNAAAQEKENIKNRTFSLRLLEMSRPHMTADQLGNLLFSQGQGAYNTNMNNMLEATLRQNLRAGGDSGAAITANFADKSASGMADRRNEATLKGITGTLPGAAAIQSAASLYRGEAPQMPVQPANYSGGNMVMGAANTLGSLWQAYQNNWGKPTGVGNQG